MCVRSLSERVLFSELDVLLRQINWGIKIDKNVEKAILCLEYNGAKRGVFLCMSLKKEYTPLPVYDDARFSDLSHLFRINKFVQV